MRGVGVIIHPAKERGGSVPTGIGSEQLGASGMLLNEVGHVVDEA